MESPAVADVDAEETSKPENIVIIMYPKSHVNQLKFDLFIWLTLNEIPKYCVGLNNIFIFSCVNDNLSEEYKKTVTECRDSLEKCTALAAPNPVYKTWAYNISEDLALDFSCNISEDKDSPWYFFPKSKYNILRRNVCHVNTLLDENTYGKLTEAMQGLIAEKGRDVFSKYLTRKLGDTN